MRNRELGKFPSNLEFLVTESSFQNYVGLPKTLKKMHNKTKLTQVTLNNLPENLEEITLNFFEGDNFTLPNSVQKILFNPRIDGFSRDTVINFPLQLKKLVLPSNYNKPIDLLANCNNLESITFSGVFNQPIDVLPPNVKTIIFSKCDFNKPINNLPSRLEQLVFSDGLFNQNIDNLPNNIKFLELNSINFNKPINNLPNGLTNLSISLILKSEDKSIIECLLNLPNNIKHLELKIFGSYIPTEKEEDLILKNISNLPNIHSLKLSKFRKITSLPTNLKYLNLQNYKDIELNFSDYPDLSVVGFDNFEDKHKYSILNPNIIFI